MQEGRPGQGLQVPVRDLQGLEEVIERSRQFMSGGESHRVFKKDGDVFVDHVDKHGGKWDVINLTKNTGAKSISAGITAVKNYHDKGGKSYYGKQK